MPTTQRNYYDLLSVPRDADEQTIKNAFRQLALQYHPDRNKAPEAEERFKKVAEAYAVLSDPQKRAAYDAEGSVSTADMTPEDLFRGIDFGTIFGGLGFDFGGTGWFDRLFRQSRWTRPTRGSNLEVGLEVSLERVRTGGEETVHLARLSVCPACHGVGADAHAAPQRCATCSGSGRTLTRWRQDAMTMQQMTTCPTCYGRGAVLEQRCALCTGQGEVPSEEAVRITLPVGVEDGMVLRVSGQGQASRTVSGLPGDLFVVIHIASDPRFERRGTDLWRTETITVVESVLGTRVEVPTLDGPTMVTVPPGTQPETVLRLRHKGLPEFEGQAHGDLYLRIRVHIPSHLTAEERTLYERLQTLHAIATDTSPTRETPQPRKHASWLTRLAHTFRRALHR